MNEFFVQTRHGRIVVRRTAGGGRPVLLIHGNSLSTESYIHQLEGRLGDTRNLVAFDLPGHGKSPRPSNPNRAYRISAYAEVAQELCAILDLTGPVLVGHSLGGHIALQAVAKGLPARALLILGTPPMGVPPDFGAAYRMELHADWFFRADLSVSEVAYLASIIMPDRQPPPPYYERSISQTDPEARGCLGASLGAPDGVDEHALIASLKIPLAVIMGEEDRLMKREFVEALSIPTLWRGAVQFIRGAGHCAQYDKPQEFNRLLSEFLADVDRDVDPSADLR